MLFQRSMTSNSEASLSSNLSLAHPDLLSYINQLDACLALLTDGHLLRHVQSRTGRNSFLLDIHACIVNEIHNSKHDIQDLDIYLQLAGAKGLYKRMVRGVRCRTELKMQVMPKSIEPYEERVKWCRWMTQELVEIVRG